MPAFSRSECASRSSARSSSHEVHGSSDHDAAWLGAQLMPCTSSQLREEARDDVLKTQEAIGRVRWVLQQAAAQQALERAHQASRDATSGTAKWRRARNGGCEPPHRRRTRWATSESCPPRGRARARPSGHTVAMAELEVRRSQIPRLHVSPRHETLVRMCPAQGREENNVLRTLEPSVSNIISRSMPKPHLPVDGMPYSRARMKYVVVVHGLIVVQHRFALRPAH